MQTAASTGTKRCWSEIWSWPSETSSASRRSSGSWGTSEGPSRVKSFSQKGWTASAKEAPEHPQALPAHIINGCCCLEKVHSLLQPLGLHCSFIDNFTYQVWSVEGHCALCSNVCREPFLRWWNMVPWPILPGILFFKNLLVRNRGPLQCGTCILPMCPGSWSPIVRIPIWPWHCKLTSTVRSCSEI